MTAYKTKPITVEADKWTVHGSLPGDEIGQPLIDTFGQPVLDEGGQPVLRTIGKIVAPYTVPKDDDGEQVDYQCETCHNAMSSHGILQLGVNSGRIVCPNSWIVKTGGLYEILRNRVFNLKYTIV